MATPIELHFYNKNNEIIKTYSQDRILWSFFKNAVKIVEAHEMNEDNINLICEFVCDFYGRKFSAKKLLKHTDVEQLLAVAGQIVLRVLNMMKEQGVTLPKAQTATKKKKSIRCRMIGFLRSKE